MMPPEVKAAARHRKLRSRAAFVALASITMVLFLAMLSSAVWRAFRTEQYPPTPTIPASVKPQFAYVSDLRGEVESQPANSSRSRRLFTGYTISARDGNRVRVGEEGWLRLGFVSGMTLFLDENTEVELKHIPGERDAVRETVVQLNQGRLLASAAGREGERLVVQVESGARAVSDNGLLGLNYDRVSRQLEIHCLRGDCNLEEAGELPVVTPGELVQVWGEQAALSAGPARFEQFQPLGDPGVVPTSTPGSSTPAPTTKALAALPSASLMPSPSLTPSSTATPSPTPTQAPWRLGALPGVPDALQQAAQALGEQYPAQLSWVGEGAGESEADVWLAVGDGLPLARWIYAVTAPFPTVEDEVTLAQLEEAWTRSGIGVFPLYVDLATGPTLAALWGMPGSNVTMIAEDQLVDRVWAEPVARALVPFSELDPRLKVLKVRGTSPAAVDFEPATYPLAIPIGLEGQTDAVRTVQALWNGPVTNRDPDRITYVAMSGPSGLGRAVGDRMNRKGLTYPGEEVATVLRPVDIAHLSNEVPFGPDCPTPSPVGNNTFCAPSEYIELMEYVGTDINEMTGNHVNDWGEHNLQLTFDLYEEVGIDWFGGGRNLEAAREPLLLEHNGNRLAFVGCNPMGPFKAWAREEYAGSLPCEEEFAFLRKQIQALKEQGYFVIATLQYLQHYQYAPTNTQQYHFGLLAEAGADAISGSQGHHAQGFGFDNGSFIHYGLGNLFFDQMDRLGTRQSFIDTYTIYEGRLLNVNLWTGLIEDYGRPRPMDESERAQFLDQIFEASGW